ncbi:MAG: sulfatase-like hydrolase/transferase [Daejeonella sp.]
MYRKLIFIVFVIFSLSCNKTIRKPSATNSVKRPNIIFVFIDDMGYGDLSIYGNAGVKTPHIDRLAEEGMRFTQFYVNSPICSPSRVAVLTGQYPLRWNITSYLADSARNIKRGMDQYLDIKAPSLARILQKEGYYTAHVGKWHMGGQRNVHGAPLIADFGFNSSYTSFEGLGERIGWIFETYKWNGSHRFPLSVEQEKLGHGSVTWITRHQETGIYVNKVLEEIKKAQEQDQPFYINLWTSDVHTPIESPPELRGDSSLNSQYLGVITELDKQLGRLFEHVRNDPKLRDNTLILLSSDNGPPQGIGSAGGLRGRKGQLYEGGIKEPFIVWAPGRVNPKMVGKVNNNTILAGMDLPPSILSIAGIKAPDSIKFDGMDMKEIWFGDSGSDRAAPVMWVRPPDTQGPTHEFQDLAIRKGKWKLLTNINGKHVELYNIESNPGETIDLAKQHPEITSDLKSEVLNWFYGIRSKSPVSVKPWK